MARVNIDGKLWQDPRARKVGRLLGWSLREVVGTLAAVWNVAYDSKCDELDVEDVDTAAEHDGFAAVLVASRMASVVSPERIRLRGVQERIAYLLKQADLGRRGGLAKAAAGQSDAKPSPSERQALAKPPSSLPLAPDIPLAHDLDLPPKAPPKLEVVKPPEAQRTKRQNARSKAFRDTLADHERQSVDVILGKLSDRSAVQYRGSEEHQRLIVSRLRSGLTEMDLRAVIAYCAEPRPSGGLGWQDNAELKQYLRPETLFGPKTIEKYLDAARTWAAKAFPGQFKPDQPVEQDRQDDEQPDEPDLMLDFGAE